MPYRIHFGCRNEHTHACAHTNTRIGAPALVHTNTHTHTHTHTYHETQSKYNVTVIFKKVKKL